MVTFHYWWRLVGPMYLTLSKGHPKQLPDDSEMRIRVCNLVGLFVGTNILVKVFNAPEPNSSSQNLGDQSRSYLADRRKVCQVWVVRDRPNDVNTPQNFVLISRCVHLVVRRKMSPRTSRVHGSTHDDVATVVAVIQRLNMHDTGHGDGKPSVRHSGGKPHNLCTCGPTGHYLVV